MSKEIHIHVRFKVQVDEDAQKHMIRDSFDTRLLSMANLSPLPFIRPALIGVTILGVKTTKIIDESENSEDKFEYNFVKINVREGENEFGMSHTIKIPIGLSQEEVFDKVIKDNLGEPEGINKDGEYEYRNAEYVVYGVEIKSMTKEEFEIVNKYL